jgi:ABC-type glutathione transport system ATPase component
MGRPWPGVKVEDIEYEELIEKVKETLQEMKLQALDSRPCPSASKKTKISCEYPIFTAVIYNVRKEKKTAGWLTSGGRAGGNQLYKVSQLFESLNQRMGVVIVGPSGSGKSTLLKVLRRALQKLNRHIPMYVMNPKAMNREQLLGYMDLDTREWYDGVLTAASRKVVPATGPAQTRGIWNGVSRGYLRNVTLSYSPR